MPTPHRRRRSDRDFAAEIESHIALEADRLRAEGLSQDEALATARRAFGNATIARERFYEASRWIWLDEFRRNLRGAIRLWRKRPLLAGAAILTIALAAGMNTALFRVVWNALLRPLPYANGERLVHVWRVDRTSTSAFTPRDRRLPDGFTIEHWRERNRSFEALAAYRPWRATIGSGGDPERVTAALVSAGFFAVLRIPLSAGRPFTNAEVRPGSDNVVLLSHGYWQRRFGGQPNLVGRNIAVDGALCRVAGIVAPGQWGLIVWEPDVYLPISKAAEGTLRTSSGWVVGRLRDGISPVAARDELEAIARAETKKPEQGVNVTPLQEEIAYSIRPALLTLFAATACVLLIACTNVANLLLAQATARRQELSVRAALGATRAVLMRQLLTEAFALAMIGGALGVALGHGLTRALTALYPGTLPRISEGGESAAVLVFALALVLSCTVLFGILPAFHATSDNLRVSRSWMGRGPDAWNSGLAGFQVALTVLLLACAGLLLKSFLQLRSIDLGFEQSRIFTAQVVLPEARYADAASQTRFVGLWIDRLKSIPGVERAAVTNSLPLAFNVLLSVQFHISGQNDEHRAGARAVTGEYFDALGLRMKEGRPLTPSDENRQDVIVVNDAFARKFLQTGPAVGTVVRFGGERPPATIVGVVRDLRNMRLQRPPEPEMYVPFSARPSAYLDVAVRTGVEPESIAAAARAELRALDPALALAQVSTMRDVVDGQVARPRFQALLVGVFAAVAVALSAVGIYGVVAQGVRARMPEFGVRAAIGARPADLFRLVVQSGMRAPLAGAVVGVAAALAVGRFLETLLYGVTPYDASVLLAATAFAVLLSLAACGLPGRHAASVDAVRALREE